MKHKSLIIKLAQNERYCSKCKKVKNVNEFEQSPSNKVLRSIENTTPTMCKECATPPKTKMTIDLSQNEKYCTGCKSVKDQKDFSNKQDYCKECKSKLMKEYYEKNRNDHKTVVLKNYKSKQVKTACECGRTVLLVSLKAHKTTQIHKDMLEIKQEIKQQFKK